MTPEQIERNRTRSLLRNMTPQQIEQKRRRNHKNNLRRVRMSISGIKFYVGSAPTIEQAQYLRQKIREEAPRARS